MSSQRHNVEDVDIGTAGGRLDTYNDAANTGVKNANSESIREYKKFKALLKLNLCGTYLYVSVRVSQCTPTPHSQHV